MDNRERPMDAAFSEQAKAAETFYGTSAPKKEKSSHAGLLICLCLALILFSTFYLAARLLGLRLFRGTDGWRIGVDGVQSSRGVGNAERSSSGQLPSECGAAGGAPVICVGKDDGQTALQRCEASSAAVVSLDVDRFQSTEHAHATGVILTANGYVLSSCGELRDALSIDCTTADGEVWEISYLGTDAQTGLTLLKLNGEGLPTVSFGAAPGATGETLLSLGSAETPPADALGGSELRAAGTDEATGLTLLQAAETLPEYSAGSPVLDENGWVIGLVSILGTQRTDDAVLCVETDGLQAAVDRILAQDPAALLWTGFDVGQIPNGLCSYFGYPGKIWIRALIEPELKQEGVEWHDVLLEADGKPVNSIEDFQAALAAHKPGEQIELVLYRYGEEYPVSVQVQAR